MPDTTLRSLVDDLASPDPAVRDDGAYAALARRLRDGGASAPDRSWLASPSPCRTPASSDARPPGCSPR